MRPPAKNIGLPISAVKIPVAGVEESKTVRSDWGDEFDKVRPANRLKTDDPVGCLFETTRAGDAGIGR
ncbi:hypothetical protein [Mesorhizobium sp. WSM3224]|uniref:hypothetical protein n=1 Tax=Mesorhizobium sp. WSM3224 TaxID=1040986 RepID=UPI0004851B5C|nr:hypothetical protein [Mesorhizobium sp. WSM3224]